MKKIVLILPLLLFACDSIPGKIGDVSYNKIDELNYEVSIAGKHGVSKEHLMSVLDEKMKTLCNMPYLLRHQKSDVTSMVGDKPNGYRLMIGGQCFTKEDMEAYERSVAAAKKPAKKAKKKSR